MILNEKILLIFVNNFYFTINLKILILFRTFKKSKQ